MKLTCEDFYQTETAEMGGIVEELLDLYGKLRSYSIDNYDLVGVDSTASAAEIEEAYNDFKKNYHPDLFDAPPHSELFQIANFVFDEVSFVFGMLIQEAYRREYAGSI